MLDFIRRIDYVYYVLVASVAVLFIGAPMNGDFYWSDAPRHLLNGTFVKDLVAAMPFSDPQGFAYGYYAQYPALTILFYPPLFYAISAPFLALFGVSHETGLFVVFLHYVAVAVGTYHLGRFWLDRFGALVFALLLVVAPEIAFWGRQTMLEIPAFAFLMWSAVMLMHYRRSQTIWQLYLSIALLVFAMYTKISVAFLLPVYFLVLVLDKGWALFRNKHSYFILALFLIGLAPLIFLTVNFGQGNVQSVSGIADSQVSRSSILGWLWYARVLPSQLGWPVLLLALAWAVALLVQKKDDKLSRNDLVFWLGWFTVGYLFFSAIDLKEARHSVYILPPVIFAAVLAIRRFLEDPLAAFAGFALVGVMAVYTFFWRPVFYVQGYQEAARYIAEHAPENSVVMFSGYRDGSFTFNMRTMEDRDDLSVLRADKLLLSISIRRELGVEQQNYSEQQIGDLIGEYGVHYVVAQPDFWTDLEQMARLQNVLQSDRFEHVHTIPTPANYPAHEKELRVYRNLGPVKEGPINLSISLPIIGRQIDSEIAGPE